MNEHLVLHDLGDRGRHWVSRCLASGKGLSTHLAPLVDLNNGTTFLLGSEASGIDETELEHGIVGSFLSPEISAQALIDVSEHLRQDSDSLLLVAEDDLRQPQDPAVVKEDHGSIVIAGGTVYHWTELPDDYSAQGLAEFLGRSSSGYPSQCIRVPGLVGSTIHRNRRGRHNVG